MDYVTGSRNEDGDRINHSFPTPRIIIIPRDPVPGSPARLFSLYLFSLPSLLLSFSFFFFLLVCRIGTPNSFFLAPSVSREISLLFLISLLPSTSLRLVLFFSSTSARLSFVARQPDLAPACVPGRSRRDLREKKRGTLGTVAAHFKRGIPRCR